MQASKVWALDVWQRKWILWERTSKSKTSVWKSLWSFSLSGYYDTVWKWPFQTLSTLFTLRHLYFGAEGIKTGFHLVQSRYVKKDFLWVFLKNRVQNQESSKIRQCCSGTSKFRPSAWSVCFSCVRVNVYYTAEQHVVEMKISER